MLTLLLYVSIVLAFISVLSMLAAPAGGIIVMMLSKPVIDTSFYVPVAFGVTLTQLFGVLVPGIIFLHMLVARRGNHVRNMPMHAIWLVYAGYVFLFSLLIVYHDGTMPGLDVFFRHINGLIGFYMMQTFFREERKMRLLFVVFIVAGIFPVATTLYQIATGTVWHHLAHMATEGGFVRTAGLYYHIMTLRYYAYQALIGLLLVGGMTERLGIVKRVFGWGYGVSILYVVFRTYSKAGFFALGLWALLWTVLQKKFMALILVLLSVLVVVPYFASDISDAVYTVFHKEVGAIEGKEVGEEAFSGRLYGWAARMEGWSELNLLSQIFGSGHIMTGAHNDYLMMLYHGGIVGLLIYVVLLSAMGVRIVREMRRKVDRLGIAALMLYLTFLIETVGLVPSAYPHFQWLVWGMVGLFLRKRHDEANPAGKDRPLEIDVSVPARGGSGLVAVKKRNGR